MKSPPNFYTHWAGSSLKSRRELGWCEIGKFESYVERVPTKEARTSAESSAACTRRDHRTVSRGPLRTMRPPLKHACGCCCEHRSSLSADLLPRKGRCTRGKKEQHASVRGHPRTTDRSRRVSSFAARFTARCRLVAEFCRCPTTQSSGQRRKMVLCIKNRGANMGRVTCAFGSPIHAIKSSFNSARFFLVPASLKSGSSSEME
jgi:hypothetical protein